MIVGLSTIDILRIALPTAFALLNVAAIYRVFVDDLSDAQRRYSMFVCLSATALVYLLAFSYQPPSLVGLVFFGGLAVLTESLKIELPKRAATSTSFTIMFASILLFGPLTAALVAALAAFNLDDMRIRLPLRVIAFNASQFALSTGIAAEVYWLAGGRLGAPGAADFPLALAAMTLAGLAFFAINTASCAKYVALQERLGFFSVWSYNFRWEIPSYTALAALGTVLAQVYEMVGPAGIVLLVIPLMIARQTFKRYMGLRDAHRGTVQSLVTALEAKDPYTRGHSERVAEYAERIARQLKLPEQKIEVLRYAALLHDVGKIGVSRKVLGKPGRLTPEEFATIREHPEIGAQIVGEVEFLDEAVSAIFHHHERLDGSGYSSGLTAQEIPLFARILTVADTYDAMTSARPYRPALDPQDVARELVDCSGRQFDRKIVSSLLAALELEVTKPAVDRFKGQLRLIEDSV